MRPPLPAARLPRAPSRPAPPPVTRRHARPSVRAPASTADATPAPDRSRYHAFELDGCEFLVARADGGVLNVADTYVLDAAAGVYSRPAGDDPHELPPPGVYAAVPWAQRFHGDTLYRKKPWSKVHKMFLVRARDDGGVGDAVLDLKTIVLLDAETRSVTREDVEDRTTTDDPSRVTLRIRPEGLFLVDSSALPTPDDIVDEALLEQQRAASAKAAPKKPFFVETSYRLDDAGNRVEEFDMYAVKEEEDGKKKKRGRKKKKEATKEDE